MLHAQPGFSTRSTLHMGSPAPKGCPPHRPGSAVSPCRRSHAGSTGHGVPGVSSQEGCVQGARGLQPPCVPAVPTRCPEARLGDVSGGGRSVGGPGPPGEEGVPPPRPPAERTSEQLPAPSLVLCLQPPLPGCRDTCQRPPAPGTPRAPRSPDPRPGSRCRSAPGVRLSPLPHPPGPTGGARAGGTRALDRPRLQQHRCSLAYPPRHGHPRAPPRRESTLPCYPVTTVPRVPARRRGLQGSRAGGRDAVHGAGVPCVGQVRCGTPVSGVGRAPGERSRAGEAASASPPPPPSAGSVRGSAGWARVCGHAWAWGGGAAVSAVGQGARPLPGRAPRGPPGTPRPAGHPAQRTASGPLRAPSSGGHPPLRRTPARRRSTGDLAQRPVPVPGPRRATPPPARSPVPPGGAR